MIRLAINFLVVMLVNAGCATMNKQHYEEPLYEMNVLTNHKAETTQIEVITSKDLANQKPGHRPPINTDEAGLWMVMDNAEDEYKTAGNLITDEKLNQYLHDISCRLTPEYCEDIRIYVLRIPNFNATMAPNGALIIWSGLLLRATSEDQIAAVLGHEIGHYLRRHSLQRLHDIVNTSSALVIVQIASAAAGYGAVGDLAYLAAISNLQAFSRDQEREADGYGLALMTRGGYRPHEFAQLWKKVIMEIEASDDKNFSILLFDSHPPSKERLAALDDLADRIVVQQNDFDVKTESYRTHILPLRHQFLKDELHQRDFSRSEVLLDYLIEDGADLGDLYYFKGELYRLRGKEGDLDRAIREYNKALSEINYPPETLRALGLLYKQKGEHDKANAALKDYLKQNPDSIDREMIMHMLSKESL